MLRPLRWLLMLFGATPSFAAEPEKPKAKFPFGKDLTLFTEPLDKDGYIDYETALNERLRGKIKPEENAVVLLMEALGPKPDGKDVPLRFFKWLGTKPPPEKGGYLVPYLQYCKKVFAPEDGDKVDQRFDTLVRKPWKATDDPQFAEWLRLNEKPLSLVDEASRQPAYYQPHVAPTLIGGRGILTASPMPATSQIREIVGLLQLRVMLLAGEENEVGAWNDVFTILRIGRLISQGGSHVELLIAIACEHAAADMASRLFERTRLSATSIHSYRDEYTKLPPLGTFGTKLALTERAMCCDFLQAIHRDGLQILEHATTVVELKTKPTEEDLVFREVIEWSVLFDTYRHWLERLDATHHLPTSAERIKAWVSVTDDAKKLANESKDLTYDPEALRGAGGKKARIAYSEKFANSLVSQLPPNLAMLSEAIYRTQQKQSLLILTFTLAAYQADHNKFPAVLADLAPKYIEQIPTDLFSDQPLLYKPSSTGYLLYSVGPNMVDDGGRFPSDNPPGDDIGVRMVSPRSK